MNDNNNSYLILEFTEFNAQRMNSDSMPMAVHVDSPELSMDAFDKAAHNIRSANIRLNSILNVLSNSGGIFNNRKDKMQDGLDIKNLKILRIYPSNDINLNIYFSFVLYDTEYYGVIRNFMDESPNVECEVFRDVNIFASREWVIKIKGLLIKTIEKWMIVEPGEYQTLKDISCTSEETGQMVEIPIYSRIEVKRNFDYNKVLISINNIDCVLSGVNFFYFNYWFKKINDK